MTKRFACALVALGLVTGPAAFASPGSAGAPDEKTAAAVIAEDKAWGDASVKGDGDFVGWLLLPEYRSINADGKVVTREQIVTSARKKGADVAGLQKREQDYAAWRASHPLLGDVRIFGDTAILNWTKASADATKPVSSCDIFVYRDGHWHAIYSQHSTAGL